MTNKWKKDFKGAFSDSWHRSLANDETSYTSYAGSIYEDVYLNDINPVAFTFTSPANSFIYIVCNIKI